MKYPNVKQARGFAKRQCLSSGTYKEAVDDETVEPGKIDHVLGMTVFSNSSLACHSDSGLVAYPAGSVLVLLDCLRNRQDSSIHTPRKMITAVCFSPDGKLVATGESGHQPSIRVWRLTTMHEIATMAGHHVGISCLSFTKQMSAIVVVGDAFDMIISVWSWPDAVMLSLNKFADKVCAMDISNDSDFFVTVGNHHVKFYCMDILRSVSVLSKDLPVPIPTRVGTLDNFKDNHFCDVACGLGACTDFVYVISSTGILCQMNRDRMLERWVNVNVSMATCLTRDEVHLFVGGEGGVIRMFQALDLHIVMTLPRPHSLGLDIAQITEFVGPVPESGGDCLQGSHQEYPTVRAMTYDHCSHQLTAIYDDRSIYIWRRRTYNGVYSFWKCYSSLYHCGCIWDLTLYPLSEESGGGALPPGSLITVSADGTLRAWDVASIISENSMLKRNAVSINCLKIVYPETDKEAGRERGKQIKRHRGDTLSPAFQRECRQAFGVVAVCQEGLHIATGNRYGRVMVYDAHSMKLVATRFAHNTEVTALSYTSTHLYKILASGSRDRMIHLMDASSDYHLLSTLDDHSSSITAIHFTYISQCLLMVSSSLDMSILVRAHLDHTPLVFNHVRAIVEKKAVVDFTMHPWSGQIALVCQDKLVRIYSLLNSQKNGNSYRGCLLQGGYLIKICMDPSGQYILTACTNKTINLIEFNTGEILHTFNGHAESITRIRFSHNLRHVISSASDGCIFMWKLPQAVAYSVKKVMAEMGLLTRGMVLKRRWKKVCVDKNVPCSMTETELNPAASDDDLTSVNQSQLVSKLLHEEVATPVGTDETIGAATPEMMEFQAETPLLSVDWNLEPVGETSGEFQPVIINDGSDSAEWLETCTQRRQLFKVEAKSIKRILSMMKLVADAMEKDLQDAATPCIRLVSEEASLLQEAMEEREGTNLVDNRNTHYVPRTPQQKEVGYTGIPAGPGHVQLVKKTQRADGDSCKSWSSSALLKPLPLGKEPPREERDKEPRSLQLSQDKPIDEELDECHPDLYEENDLYPWGRLKGDYRTSTLGPNAMVAERAEHELSAQPLDFEEEQDEENFFYDGEEVTCENKAQENSTSVNHCPRSEKLYEKHNTINRAESSSPNLHRLKAMLPMVQRRAMKNGPTSRENSSQVSPTPGVGENRGNSLPIETDYARQEEGSLHDVDQSPCQKSSHSEPESVENESESESISWIGGRIQPVDVPQSSPGQVDLTLDNDGCYALTPSVMDEILSEEGDFCEEILFQRSAPVLRGSHAML